MIGRRAPSEPPHPASGWKIPSHCHTGQTSAASRPGSPAFPGRSSPPIPPARAGRSRPSPCPSPQSRPLPPETPHSPPPPTPAAASSPPDRPPRPRQWAPAPPPPPIPVRQPWNHPPARRIPSPDRHRASPGATGPPPASAKTPTDNQQRPANEANRSRPDPENRVMLKATSPHFVGCEVVDADKLQPLPAFRRLGRRPA